MLKYKKIINEVVNDKNEALKNLNAQKKTIQYHMNLIDELYDFVQDLDMDMLYQLNSEIQETIHKIEKKLKIIKRPPLQGPR